MLYFNLWMVIARLTTAIANNENLTLSSLTDSLPMSGEEISEVLRQMKNDIGSGAIHPEEKMKCLLDSLH